MDISSLYYFVLTFDVVVLFADVVFHLLLDSWLLSAGEVYCT